MATYLRAAAIHEAAHTIAAFHWDIPIGERGVSITPEPTGDTARGFSDVRWIESKFGSSHADYVGTLIAPFAEYKFWRDHNEHYNNDLFYLACSNDFAHIGKAGYVEVTSADVAELAPNGFNQPQRWASICGERLLRLWCDKPQHVAGTNAETLDLVRDTDQMLREYSGQIAAFAGALLSADEHRLSQRDVIAWRNEHFNRREVMLSVK
jgi:hypothetical protein